MISVKIRGSIMAVTAAVAAATVFMAPTVSADTKPTRSAAVVADKGDEKDKDKGRDKDKDDERENCGPILMQLDSRLQLAADSLDSTTPLIPTARTALEQADRRVTALEDSKCLCAEEADLLRDLLDAVFAPLNATPPSVPEARERLAHLILAVDVFQATFKCDNGKCGGDDMING
ncbi:hypothetical protein J7E88_13495 [Streptomyces sp. ISL-10]|uniref:hypothetical protein n=1 Tax=Streptomyces sp. ISL-10 TaxID=2819172 RepID=UPI001BE4F731|nr:hypothetical protein [Streptomyces sp. ISL-10]MBT2366292.1 hypothetical protein [Streptomyces sp. ISL-10]